MRMTKHVGPFLCCTGRKMLKVDFGEGTLEFV